MVRGGVSVSLAQTIGIVVLAVLLTATLSTANVVAVSHQTVLDPEFVSDALDEGGAYEAITDSFTQQTDTPSPGTDTTDETGTSTSATGVGAMSGGDFRETIVEDVLTEAYIRNQTEANVHRFYAFLHGNADEPRLYVQTRPLKNGTEAAVETEVENTSTSALLDRVAANGSSLSDETAVGVDPAVVSTMADNESSYEAAQAEVRADVREQVVDTYTERAYTRLSTDEKLALVIPDYDPNEYSESEKEQLVAEREDEIRAAVRDRVEQRRGDEIDRAVDEQLASLADEASDPSDPDANVTTATRDFRAAVVDGLAGQLTYSEFQTETTQAKAALADAVARQARQTFDEEVPDRVSMTDQYASPSQYQQARQMVGYLDMAAIAVPLLAVVLVGLLYAISQSVVTTIRTTGTSLLFAGLPLFVTAEWAKRNLESLLPPVPEEMDMMTTLLSTFIGRVLGVTAAQSLSFVVVGLLLIGVSIGLSRGVFDDVIERET